MTQFTQAWIDAQNARLAPKVEVLKPYDGPEADIHEKIIDFCKAKGWYYVHSRMDRAATNQVGAPDFIIATNEGTLWVEVKRKGSKVSPEQRATNYWLKTLGHRAYIVWSFDEFLSAVNTEKQT